MDLTAVIYNIPFPRWILIIVGFLLAFGITWVTIPSIVRVARLKKLYADANSRASHTISTPTLGGIAIFIGFILAAIIVSGTHYIPGLRYIIAGLIVVFFVGVKDDILIIDPYKKLAGQIFAAILIAVFADIRINNLYGLFQIYQLPYMISIFLTVFVFIVIINGFNLIDGIDGLAAGIGIVSAATFGLWFWISGNIPCATLSFSLIGALTAFFCFNVFGKTNKIFLGDTGSLVLGFIISVLACRLLEQESSVQGGTYIASAPTVVCGILIIPLFDSLRVFILRILQGKSPFKADRQHLHHRLLQLKFTHLQATLILIAVNLFFIVLSYSLRGLGIFWLMALIVGIACMMSSILVFFARKRTQKAIDTLHPPHSVHSVVDKWNERNKIKVIIRNRPDKIRAEHTKEKVNSGLKKGTGHRAHVSAKRIKGQRAQGAGKRTHSVIRSFS